MDDWNKTATKMDRNMVPKWLGGCCVLADGWQNGTGSDRNDEDMTFRSLFSDDVLTILDNHFTTFEERHQHDYWTRPRLILKNGTNTTIGHVHVACISHV